MNIFILRHGEAGFDAPNDKMRKLTEKGRYESYIIGEWLAHQYPVIDRVLVSPYCRAQQTWSVMASLFSVVNSVETLDMLVPSGDASQVASYIQAITSSKTHNILLVSHLPLVGYLVSAFVPNEQPPMFSPSEIACLQWSSETGRGRLVCQKRSSNVDNSEIIHSIMK